MRYHNITKDDMKNGDGLRVVLWVSGCHHRCAGCQNKITWALEDGLPFDRAAKEEIFSELQKPYVSGVTLSGGDPLHPDNRDAVGAFLKEMKGKFPQKSVWLYTGDLWEEILELSFLPLIDVLVDGEYVAERRNTKLRWRGSDNQRVVDVKKSLSVGGIVLHCK